MRHRASSPRHRVGLLVPAINVIVEDELVPAAPLGVGVHVHRLDVDRSLSLHDQFVQMIDGAPAGAATLAKARVEAVGFACTSASFFKGPSADCELADSMAGASGVPAVTTAGALVEGLRHLQSQRIALATPYVRWVREAEAGFLEEAGFEVTSVVGLDKTGGAEIAELREQEIRDLVDTADRPKADAIVVSCTDLPVLSLVEELESHHDKPVVSSNQAMLWALLRLVGSAAPSGYGRLLSTS